MHVKRTLQAVLVALFLTSGGSLALAASAPSSLVATAVSKSQINLTWDAALGATYYEIERDGTTIVYFHPDTDYSDMGLDPDTGYDYRVRTVKEY